eukprot:1812696-Prymnesium_polylepis.1
MRRSGLVLNSMMVTTDDHHTQSDQYDGHDPRPSSTPSPFPSVVAYRRLKGPFPRKLDISSGRPQRAPRAPLHAQILAAPTVHY